MPVPALDSLTYSLPENVAAPPSGARVLVPLGSRVLTGCVVDDHSGNSPSLEPRTPSPDQQLKEILEVVEEEAFLPAEVMQLATWVAEYYACGIGEALATAMPPLSTSTEPASDGARSSFKTIRIAHLTATAPAQLFGLYPRKGVIAVGADADLALVDPAQEWTFQSGDLQTRSGVSAYLGKTFTGKVVRTIVRGVTVFTDGEVTGTPGVGAFLRPNQPNAN